MGTMGTKIVGVDVKKLLDLLNKALADEWLAYYQYWAGAKVAKGPMRPNVADEFEEHAKEELGHANKVAERIIQLGGTPIISPDFSKSNCKYDAPKNPFVVNVLKQNIKAEQCAIETYKKLIDFVRSKDDVTYDMVLSILKEEVEHEEELQMLLEDIGLTKKV
ncbi:ferritin-like domain-containing protein [Candidatus Woesearchaeota archaeon]|nr:ferritin-like domain-containing protein [Candidatus Woesearchaeota archaeon]